MSEKLIEGRIKKIVSMKPLDTLQLKLLGVGAENVCFAVPESKKKIIKVDKSLLKEYIYLLINDDEKVSYTKKEIENRYKEKLKYNRDIYDKVIDIFGEGHILRNGLFRKKVKISKVIMKEIIGDEYADIIDNLTKDVYDIDLIIQTQPIAYELEQGVYKTISIDTYLITEDLFKEYSFFKDFYDNVDKLVKEEFVDRVVGEAKLYGYTGVLKELAVKMVMFVKKHRVMLDIFGPNNITIFRDSDGSINYHLIDVVLPGGKYWDKSILIDEDMVALRHVYTFYTSIYQLAKALGVTEDDNIQIADLKYFDGSELPFGNMNNKT